MRPQVAMISTTTNSGETARGMTCAHLSAMRRGVMQLRAGAWVPTETDTPYSRLGGREAVLALAESFYDAMDATEPELARLHELDEQGRVSRRMRDRFGLFLVGWLGGPQEYM